MVNILDKYYQISFETEDSLYKYSGTCNIKENAFDSIRLIVYTIKEDSHVGNVDYSDEGMAVSLSSLSNLEVLQNIASTLDSIKNSVKNQLKLN